jgi:uncharacterized membrane protein YccF (DUF307 family)
MRFIGNVIWLIFGGWCLALEYLIGGVILCITIIGIPFGLQAFKLGMLAIWPFGWEAVRVEKDDGCLTLFMNVLWLLVGGIWLCLMHTVYGMIFCLTIIGIPFGMQHFKLLGLAVSPFGREIRRR